MTGFDVPQNFTQDPDSHLRRFRPRVVPPQISLSTAKPVVIAPSTSHTIAQKTLRDFSAPCADNVLVGPSVINGAKNFKIMTSLIMMVQVIPFYGKANEDASAHLQQFLELYTTFVMKGVTQDAIRLRLFPFSLLGKAKQWFYANRSAVDTWQKCTKAFPAKFFPMAKPMLLEEESPVSSRRPTSQFLKLGRGFRSTS
jgi:hypothetical protein